MYMKRLHVLYYSYWHPYYVCYSIYMPGYHWYTCTIIIILTEVLIVIADHFLLVVDSDFLSAPRATVNLRNSSE